MCMQADMWQVHDACCYDGLAACSIGGQSQMLLHCCVNDDFFHCSYDYHNGRAPFAVKNLGLCMLPWCELTAHTL